jgi:hypothetical protein
VTPPGAVSTSRWWTVLTAVLAAGYLSIGATSPQPSIRWAALAGGLLVLAALWVAPRSRPAALAVLLVGALLPSVIAWWSLALPATGCLILLCGTTAIRATTRTTAVTPKSDTKEGRGHGTDLPARTGA